MISNIVSALIILEVSSSDSLDLLSTPAQQSVNPWMLMVVGMTTVFVGLVVINMTINILKKLTHQRLKADAIESEDEESKIIEALRRNVNLNEEEIIALCLGIAIEYELYYSDEEQIMTFNYPDREPGWINTRR